MFEQDVIEQLETEVYELEEALLRAELRIAELEGIVEVLSEERMH